MGREWGGEVGGVDKMEKSLKFIKKNAHSGEGVKWLITMV